MTTLIVIARVFAFIGGVILAYGGAVLKEDEERFVQNTLEAWWVRIDDLRRNAIGTHVALTREAASLANAIIDRFFGVTLFSARSFATSACLSFVSVHIATSIIWNHAEQVLSGRLPTTRMTGYWMVAAIFTYAVTPYKSYVLRIAGVVAAACVLGAGTHRRLSHGPLVGITFLAAYMMATFIYSLTCCSTTVGPMIGLLVALGFGVLSDFAAIALARRLLRIQIATASFGVLTAVGILQLALGAALLLVPFLLGSVLMRVTSPGYLGLLGWMFAASSLTNFFGAAAAIALFLSVFVLLLHRVLWPVIERPLYTIARVGIFRTGAGRFASFAAGWEMMMIALGRDGVALPTLLRLLRSA